MRTELYFLGAGKPIFGDRPSALKAILSNTRTLDWQLDSFSGLVNKKDTYFLGGYHVDEVVNLYPDLNFRIVPDWKSKTILDTLLTAPFSGDAAFISYSDTLFRKEFLEQLPTEECDLAVVVDSLWKGRYQNRSKEDIANAETLGYLGKEVEFTV